MSIVTLPYHADGHRAVSFNVIGVHGDRVFLVDLCADWNGYAPVTKAVREVFRHCDAVYGKRRIIVRDASRGWLELLVENDAFDVRALQDDVPFLVSMKYLLAQPHVAAGGA